MSKISQNDLHVLHNSYTCQTCKIIGVNIELVILAFILLPLGHANFECQQVALPFVKGVGMGGPWPGELGRLPRLLLSAQRQPAS